MAQTKQTRGACAFCGRQMTGNGMVKHLSACPERKKALGENDGKTGKEEKIYHLKVQDAWLIDFWLHLEIRGSATLKDLDSYLRTIWLECCGHLSQFSVGANGNKIAMNTEVGTLFHSGLVLTHLYDFGDSSETLIKVVTEREGTPMTAHPIYLMARNELPAVETCGCGKPGAWICMDCADDADEVVILCKKHAEEEKYQDHAMLPIANSPRTGRCGYEGPAEPPY
ncbi:B box-type domain-containing protein [Candidatus Electrothrix aarhusensis]